MKLQMSASQFAERIGKIDTIEHTASEKVGEAPTDGNEYVRKNGTWTKPDTYSKAEANETFLKKTETPTLDNVYTKVEVDEKFEAKGTSYTKEETYTKAEVEAKIPTVVDAYSKTESDERYPQKDSVYTKGDTYSKNEVDAKIPTVVDAYSKTESDERYPLKNNVYAKDKTYTKEEVDAKIPAPVDAYTKAESDEKFAAKTDLTNINDAMDESSRLLISSLITHLSTNSSVDESWMNNLSALWPEGTSKWYRYDSNGVLEHILIHHDSSNFIITLNSVSYDTCTMRNITIVKSTLDANIIVNSKYIDSDSNTSDLYLHEATRNGQTAIEKKFTLKKSGTGSKYLSDDGSYKAIDINNLFFQPVSVTTLTNLPVDKYSIAATVSAASTISFASTPQNGMEYVIDIKNTSSSDITQPIPTDSNWQCDVDSVTLPAGKVASISIRYVHSIYCVRV